MGTLSFKMEMLASRLSDLRRVRYAVPITPLTESAATISMVPAWAVLSTMTTPPLLMVTPMGELLTVQKMLPVISLWYWSNTRAW